MVQPQVAGIVKDGLGRVRSGWVLLTFAAANAVLYFALMALTALDLALAYRILTKKG